MDFKQTFEGGEPNIGMPDLMLMQYSNYFGIQAIAETLGNGILTGCQFTITSINYTTKLANWSLSEGYAIINKELVKIDALSGTNLDLANNVPAQGQGQYKIFLTKDVTYNPKGTKTFNDGDSHDTWKETREDISFNGYLATPNQYELHICDFNYNYGGSGSYTVTMYDENLIVDTAQTEAAALIAANNKAKFGTLSANKTVITDGTGKLVSSSYGVPGTTANSVAVIGSAGLTGSMMVSTDATGKLTTNSDHVFVKKYDLGPWNMNANNDPKDFLLKDLGLPLGYTILKADVAIIDDDGTVRFNYSSTINNGDSPLIIFYGTTPKIQVLNNSFYNGSTLFNGTTKSRGYILVSYTL